MIIALFGRSSSGKTTIAQALAAHLGKCSIRHCGELIKERARNLSVCLGNLPYYEHQKIDIETVESINTNPDKLIVEGRYLHWVLSRTQTKIYLIEIDCSDIVRIERWKKRSNDSINESELSHMDLEDKEFTMKMYESLSPRQPGLKIDTTSDSLDKSVQQILNWLPVESRTIV